MGNLDDSDFVYQVRKLNSPKDNRTTTAQRKLLFRLVTLTNDEKLVCCSVGACVSPSLVAPSLAQLWCHPF